jgi:TM2 domain-containing membrane protein YozV
VAWLLGFTGAHRFYFGKKLTGTLWFFTLGLLGIGWLIDIVLIPAMAAEAKRRFRPGEVDYTVTWLLFTFLGVLGIHRLYMGKWITAILYLLTGGVFFLGIIYDLFTLNEQVDEVNVMNSRFVYASAF